MPSDSRGRADDYARFSTVLSQANIADDIQVAIEYHCSPVGRTRIDVLLAGGDGYVDNGLIIELKAWDTASTTDISGMVLSPIGGGTVKQHPSLQAHNYKGMILSFNQSIADENAGAHAFGSGLKLRAFSRSSGVGNAPLRFSGSLSANV